MSDYTSKIPLLTLCNKEFRSVIEIARLGLLKKQFARTKNGLYAWEAYRICRKHGRSFPGWLYSYLDCAASSLVALDPQPKDLRHRVAKAFRLSENPARSRTATDDALTTAISVLRRVNDDIDQGRTVTKLDPYFVDVANETGKSANTIRSWCEKYAPDLFQKTRRDS